MGLEVCRAVASADDMTLVAAVDPGGVGQVVEGLVVVGEAAAMEKARVQVAVDFTHAEAARGNLAACAAAGIHAVVGTTGLDDADLDRLAATFTRSNVLIAANFAIGAVLMMRFAELAAPFFDTAEIIELHHDTKIDAPSGTAVVTAERMAAARTEPFGADPTRTEVYPGARGGSGPAGIRVHSVRMRGMVANQEVILGTAGQSLTLRHDTTDRTSFMPGVIVGIRRIGETPGLTRGLETLLGLS